MASTLQTNLKKIQSNLTEFNNWIKAMMYHEEYVPLPYIPVEYIECTGAQYFNLNYIPNTNTGVECRVNITRTDGNNQILFGSRPSYRNSEFSFWHTYAPSSSDYMVIGYGSNVETRTLYPMYGSIADISYRNRVFTIKDTSGNSKYTYTMSSASLSSAVTMYLLSGNIVDGGSSQDFKTGSAKLYSFKIYEGDTLIRNYIPVKRREDGVACLYDLINETFLLNAGTGNFIAGGEL